MLWKDFFSHKELIWTCIWNEPWHLEVHILSFLFFLFNFFYYFGKKKKVTKFYPNPSKPFICPKQNPSWMFTLFPPEGLAPSFKSSIHFHFHSQMGIALSSKGSVNYFKKISPLIFIGLLVSLPMPLGF